MDVCEGTKSGRLFTPVERKGKESISEVQSSSMIAGMGYCAWVVILADLLI
jgi:hypothetical protein